MNRFTKVLGASVLALTLVAPLARATQVLYRTPQQLGTESALVVSGKVTQVRSYWNESRTKILTEARVAVDESYKGVAGNTVRVVQLGGVVGHVRMSVHGALSWRPGEEVLLFLEPLKGGDWQVSGFSQGKFRVVRDHNGTPLIQNAPDSGVEVLGAPGAEDAVPRVRNPRVELNDFVNQALGRK
ncbi:MAG: hypothetical protein KAJ37_05775 [Candidatus Krumholzibacteria bacterium]|nr:hypothetical protein [Candidatus Krumholzibacteria bacterium]